MIAAYGIFLLVLVVLLVHGVVDIFEFEPDDDDREEW